MPIEITDSRGSTVDLTADVQTERPVWKAIADGLLCRCPSCRTGPLFAGYLQVADHCANCGEALHHQRADDAPPYVTIFIVGHIIVGLVLSLEMAYAPPSWVHALIWLPLTVVLSLAMLRPIKGAFVALQWALRMHGFGGDDDMPTLDRETLAAHTRDTREDSRPE